MGSDAERDMPGGVSRTQQQETASRWCLGLATALALLATQSAWLGALAYPLRLVATMAHEASHLVAVWLTGGQVLRLAVHVDASGCTEYLGGVRCLVAPAGYLGGTLFGCALLYAAQRPAWHLKVLIALTAAVAIVVLGYARDLPTLGVGLGSLVALAACLRRRGNGDLPLVFALDLVGMACVLYAFADLRALLVLSGSAPEVETDAVTMARLTGLPSLVWALLWSACSFKLAWLTVKHLVRPQAPPPFSR